MIEKIRKQMISRCEAVLGNKAKNVTEMLRETRVRIGDKNTRVIATAYYQSNVIVFRNDMENFADDFVEELLVHEFMHLIVDEVYSGKVIRNHGKEYKDMFVALGYPREWGSATCSIRYKVEPKKETVKFKYIAKCSAESHWQKGYTRNCHVTNNPHHYSCPVCGAKIKIEEAK